MTATTVDGTGFDQLRAQVQAELLARLPDHIERLRWSRQQIEASQREALSYAYLVSREMPEEGARMLVAEMLLDYWARMKQRVPSE